MMRQAVCVHEQQMSIHAAVHVCALKRKKKVIEYMCVMNVMNQ